MDLSYIRCDCPQIPVLLIYIWYISMYHQKAVTPIQLPKETTPALPLQYRNSIVHGWVYIHNDM